MKALVTGFKPYGEHPINPSSEVALGLDGETIENIGIHGRLLDVSFQTLENQLEDLLRELQPDIVIALGLWPGEPVIRIERYGLGMADFEIPDNAGLLLSNQPIGPQGALAHAATLPIHAIEMALGDALIPARLSATAGTYLCNATLYLLLSLAARLRPGSRCGFIHLPYLPEQVATLMRSLRRERQMELHQRGDLASMSLDTMLKAIRIAITVTARSLRGD